MSEERETPMQRLKWAAKFMLWLVIGSFTAGVFARLVYIDFMLGWHASDFIQEALR